MSHISTVDAEFNCEESIREAAAECGLEVAVASSFRYYAGNNQKCDLKMFIPGNERAYECGFTKKEDGSYELKYDLYRGGYGLKDKVGDKFGAFQASYKHHRLKRELKQRGVRYKESRVKGKDGRMKRRLVATVRR